MLIFESWPPELGKVTFSSESEKLFSGCSKWGYGEEVNHASQVGRYAGDLLVNNASVEVASEIIEDLANQALALKVPRYADTGSHARMVESFRLNALQSTGAEWSTLIRASLEIK